MHMPGNSYQPNLVDACGPGKLLQLCPTLCDPVGCSPPGSYVHGILQARVLEWVAVYMPPNRNRVIDIENKPMVTKGEKGEEIN